MIGATHGQGDAYMLEAPDVKHTCVLWCPLMLYFYEKMYLFINS